MILCINPFIPRVAYKQHKFKIIFVKTYMISELGFYILTTDSVLI